MNSRQNSTDDSVTVQFHDYLGGVTIRHSLLALSALTLPAAALAQYGGA